MKPKYHIRAVDRALRVLECFTMEKPECTVDELVACTELNRSVVYRVLRTLQERGYVEHDHDKEREIYRLGPAVLRLAAVVLGSMDIRGKGRPYLEELTRATGETTHLAILDHGEGMVIERIDSFRSMRLASHVGFRSPLHCTGVGKVLLAFLPPDEIEDILGQLEMKKFTPNTITDREALRSQLQLIRTRGYALDDEETEIGLRCVAAPVRDLNGKVVASLSVSGPASRLSEEALPRRIDTVVRTADSITRALGGRESVRDG